MVLTAIPRRNRTVELGERSRRRIREVASALMAERGYVGTSVSAVAKRSRLPASSLYWHFGSKQGLLAAVAAEGGAQWLELIPEWEDLTGSVRRTPGENAARNRSPTQWKARSDQTVADPLHRARSHRPGSVRTIRGVRRAAIAKFQPAMKALIESLGGPAVNFSSMN